MSVKKDSVSSGKEKDSEFSAESFKGLPNAAESSHKIKTDGYSVNSAI